MKKAKPTSENKVAIETSYRFSMVTENILRTSMKEAGITNSDKIIRDNKPAVANLTKEIIETKHEVKSIRLLLERRVSKFEGLTEYDQHFIKAFAREAAISLAGALTKNATSPAGPKIIIYLSSDGDLYREPKSQYCFRMEVLSGRMKLVTALMASKKYVPTRTLIELTDLSSVKSIQSAVYEIRQAVEKKLKVPNFIDGWQDSGYRIHPDIILKKA